ncbi:MAG: helicase HerA domain-containing protein [Candidatus Bipolaricaulota bacterium]
MKELYISDDLDFSLGEIIGKCIGILGIRGSGKSNTAGVIFEELLKHNYPLTVVDIDGEYFGLKEEYELLVIGEGKNVDITIEPEDAPQVAEISLKQSIPVILDLSGYLKEEQRNMLKHYFTALWNWAGKLRKPYMIGIEESHEFIPQGKKSELKEIITRLSLRGRKRGLGAVIISQRSAKVEKDVLTQAGMLFLHRVVHEADMKVYNDLLPWKKGQVREKVNQLDTGDCIYLDEKTTKQIYVRERSTFHAGFTPSLDTVETPQLKQVGESIIEAIEEAKKKGERKKSRVDELEEQVGELQEELSKKTEKVKELKRTAETLGYIEVDLDPPDLPKVHKVSRAVIESLEIADVLKEGEEGEAMRAVTETLADSQGKKSQKDKRKGIDRVERSIPGFDELDKSEAKGKAKTFGLPYDGESHEKDVETEAKGEKKRQEEPNFEELPSAIKQDTNYIVKKTKQLSRLDRKILGFLVAHRPHSYSIDQISAWLNKPTGLLLSKRPTELLDLGLIIRENKSTGLHYRANLKGFVEQKFSIYEPDLGPREKHLVISKLKKEFTRRFSREDSPGNGNKKKDKIKLTDQRGRKFKDRNLYDRDFSFQKDER